MKKLLCLAALVLLGAGSYAQKNTWLFVGTYTDGKPAEGIYVFRLNTETGELTRSSTGTAITNPSFLSIAPNGKYLYACTDTKTLLTGSISSFSIDSSNGSITFINKQSSEGANPVYVSVFPENTLLAVANYTEGNAAVLGINKNGSLKPALQSIRFTDSSINKLRQEKSHIHAGIFSPNAKYLYLPDLGSDKIRAFTFDAHNALPLTANERLTVKTVPGSGPRHMVFHPKKNIAYCIEEMSGMLVVYQYKNGLLVPVQRMASYSQQAAEHSGADIHVSPDGLFVYSSNRGENTISIFSADKTGKLRLVGHVPSGGDTPRNFSIDPTGNFLLVANQTSNNIIVFKRDHATGKLTKTAWQVTVPAPSSLQLRTYGR